MENSLKILSYLVTKLPTLEFELEEVCGIYGMSPLASCIVPNKRRIDPIIKHGSLLGKCIGSNKRSVPNESTVSSNWNTRVIANPRRL